MHAASDLSPSVDWLSSSFSLNKGSLSAGFSSLAKSSPNVPESILVSLKA